MYTLKNFTKPQIERGKRAFENHRKSNPYTIAGKKMPAWDKLNEFEKWTWVQDMKRVVQ